MVLTVEISVYRKIVLYIPNNHKTGIKIKIDSKTEFKFKFCRRTKRPKIKVKAIHVLKIHIAKSTDRAIISLKIRGNDKILSKNKLVLPHFSIIN